jgi:2-dehydro-3-deoxyphosphogluconate aldolase/(4S)-4-hydroxy-2-oxoglutarate aldolase
MEILQEKLIGKIMNKTIDQIIKHKLVPVFYNDDKQWCLVVMNTCFKNGIKVFEFTNRGKNALANFSTLHQFQQANCPNMLLGAGTIFDKEAAADFIATGASFIVSPCFVDEVMHVCKQNKIPYLPGCMTVKEIFDANAAGCKIVKVFPGQVVGPSFVKAAKAVLPGVKLMVTGGVTEHNMKEWLIAGTDAIGTGSLQSVEVNNHKRLISQIKSLQLDLPGV